MRVSLLQFGRLEIIKDLITWIARLIISFLNRAHIRYKKYDVKRLIIHLSLKIIV